MELYSSAIFFLLVSAFAVVFSFASKRVSPVVAKVILLIATVSYYLLAYGSSSKRLFVFTCFYLLVVYLAFYLKKVPRILFVIISLAPLLAVKISDVVPSLLWAHDKVVFMGISYVSFRVVQILVDIDAYKSLNLAALIVFLINPLTLLAGPIDHYQRFENNLQKIGVTTTGRNLFIGIHLVLWGVLQKFVFAYYWDKFILSAFSSSSLAASEIAGTAYSYTIYLFLDFSGYSLMAIGFGRMMGLMIPRNFDKPWKTKNPQDLWRRFHITLGSFLNDYFFKPIYMSFMRVQMMKSHRLAAQNLALFLTFMLMGAWNGLKWNYLLSGFMFGVASVVYNSFGAYKKIFPAIILSPTGMMSLQFFFLNYVVWALYFFSGRLPV